MGMYRQLANLWTLASGDAANTAQTGTGKRIIPSTWDAVADGSMNFKLVTSLTQSGGATSPTSQLKLEGSWDGGTTWMPLVSGTQRTADGTYNEVLDVPVVAPAMRVVTVVGGATAPNHYGQADLVCDASFSTQDIA